MYYDMYVCMILEQCHLQCTACSGDTDVLPFHFHRGFFVRFMKCSNSSSGDAKCLSACLQYSLQMKYKINECMKNSARYQSTDLENGIHTNLDALSNFCQKNRERYLYWNANDEFHLDNVFVYDSIHMVREP